MYPSVRCGRHNRFLLFKEVETGNSYSGDASYMYLVSDFVTTCKITLLCFTDFGTCIVSDRFLFLLDYGKLKRKLSSYVLFVLTYPSLRHLKKRQKIN